MGTNNVVKTLTEIKSNVPLLKSNAVKTLTEIKKSNMKQNNGVETLRPRSMSYSRTRTRRTVSRSGGGRRRTRTSFRRSRRRKDYGGRRRSRRSSYGGGGGGAISSAASVAKTAIAGYTVYNLLKGQSQNNMDEPGYESQGPSGRKVLSFMMRTVIGIIFALGCCLLLVIAFCIF